MTPFWSIGGTSSHITVILVAEVATPVTLVGAEVGAVEIPVTNYSCSRKISTYHSQGFPVSLRHHKAPPQHWYRLG